MTQCIPCSHGMHPMRASKGNPCLSQSLACCRPAEEGGKPDARLRHAGARLDGAAAQGADRPEAAAEGPQEAQAARQARPPEGSQAAQEGHQSTCVMAFLLENVALKLKAP